MFREIAQKKRFAIELLIIAFFFCVFFLMPVFTNAATAPFSDGTIGILEKDVDSVCNDGTLLPAGIVVNAACCANHTNQTIDVKSCVDNLYGDDLSQLHLTGSYSSCTPSGTPTASTNNNCYQKVTLKDTSGNTTVGNYFYNSTEPIKTDKCSTVGNGTAGVDFCIVSGSSMTLQCLGKLKEAYDGNGKLNVCCTERTSGKLGIYPSESYCKEAPIPATCDAPNITSNDEAGSKVCCVPLTSDQITSECSSFKTAATPSPTCTVDNSTYKNDTCSIKAPLSSHCASCAVTLKCTNCAAGETNVKTARTSKTPTNPGSDNTSTTSTGNAGQVDNSPKTQACGVTGDSTTKVTAADCCKQNAATISDATKASAELTNCNACLNKGPNYSWSGLGCINTSREGIVLSILRIFYGIGTGLLVLRIVIAGIKLINNPDSPDALKESKQEISSSIVAFVFGVLTIILLRFIGISVLGISWIDNILPKLV